jgi:hypothetical protein
MAGTYLNPDECKVILDVINRRYFYDEDNERTQFSSKENNIDRCIVDSLKKRKILDGYGEAMRVRYEYYVSACTQCDLTKSFMDLDNPTENELVIFELESGFKLRKTMIGQYVYDEAEIYNR